MHLIFVVYLILVMVHRLVMDRIAWFPLTLIIFGGL